MNIYKFFSFQYKGNAKYVTILQSLMKPAGPYILCFSNVPHFPFETFERCVNNFPKRIHPPIYPFTYLIYPITFSQYFLENLVSSVISCS